MARIAFLFPGQGAQKVGMGQQLYENLPAARRLFDQAADILGYSLADVCFHGPPERLNSTVISQPALFVCSLAALESLRSTDPDEEKDCVATAGLSLGEYTALVFAGSLSFPDGLRVVQRRGEAMQAAADATPSGMVSIIGLDRSEVEDLCSAAQGAGPIQVANLLCPGNTVVSGVRAACDELEKLAAENGARTVRLPVAGAFHTDLMRPADETLASVLAGVEIRPPRVPVWSNVDARPHTEPTEIRDLLVRQVLRPVLWEETMRNLLAEGCDRFYEIGPGTVLSGLLKRVQRKIDCRPVQNPA
jgi:[acyl-carrier-protein] S-malonyltransferase